MSEQHRKTAHPDYWHREPIKPTFQELERFMANVKVMDICGNGIGPCWIWTGARGGFWKDYGTFHIQGNSGFAHRVSYRIFNGKIPKRYIVDHICENKRCVNPKHLKAVTLTQNNLLYHRRRDKWTLPIPFDKKK